MSKKQNSVVSVSLYVEITMNKRSIINTAFVESSVARRDKSCRRREIERAQTCEVVTEHDPRRLCGMNPNSRESRQWPTHSTSSHLQDWEYTMKEQIFIGIDVAKDTFCVCSSPAAVNLSLSNSGTGIKQLINTLKQHDIKLIVLEATGGYERPIVAGLLEADFNVVVASPRQVRQFARGIGELAKTDPIDARVLARFAQVVQPKPRPQFSCKTEELANLVTRRNQLTELRTKELNRQQTVRHPKVCKSIRKMIKTLNYQIAQIDQLITEHIQSDEQLSDKDKIIRSTPGVGPQTSAILLSQLPELGLLNRQQIAALVGVAPYDFRSGKFAGQSRIWGGRKEIRNMLYMAALTAMRYNPVIKHFSDRLKSQGKKFKVVVTACMRKLLIILNSMVRNETLWKSEKISKNN